MMRASQTHSLTQSLFPSRLAGLFVLFIAFGAISSASAQQVGDRVVVTSSFDTKIYNRKVGQVFEGGIHTITAIEGKWCSVSDVKGWLPMQNVMNLSSAMKVYNKRIRDNPRDAYAFAHRGMIALELGDLDQALKDLDQSYRLNPVNLLTLNNIAKVLNAQQRYGDAKKILEDIVARNKEFPLAWYNLGLTHYALNEHEQAVQSFDQAIQLAPNNAWFYLSRGSARLNNGNSDGAISDYRAALKLDPRLADAYVGLSNVALTSGDINEAMVQAERAVTVQPRNAMALNARGWLRYLQDDLEGAIEDFNQAIRFAPELAVAYNNRGVTEVARENFDLAIKNYSQALQLAGGSPITYANRGTAWVGKGDFGRAKLDFEKALELAPGLPEAANAFAWFLATCPDESFRNGQQAVELATAACTESDFENWTYLDTLAAAHAENGEFEKALERIDQALELAPAEERDASAARRELYAAGKPFRSERGKLSGRSGS